MKTREFSISTDHEGMYNITARLREVIRESGVQSGLAVVYCPHTTAGITINENADPDVQHDLLLGLREAFPDRREFRHAEGNSTAHLKCSYVGPSQTVLIEDGKPILGNRAPQPQNDRGEWEKVPVYAVDDQFPYGHGENPCS